MNNIEQSTQQIQKALNAYFKTTELTKKGLASSGNISVGTVQNCFKAHSFNMNSFLVILENMGMNLYDFVAYMQDNNYELPESNVKLTRLNTKTITTMVDQGIDKDQIAMRAGLTPEEFDERITIEDEDEMEIEVFEDNMDDII